MASIVAARVSSKVVPKCTISRAALSPSFISKAWEENIMLTNRNIMIDNFFMAYKILHSTFYILDRCFAFSFEKKMQAPETMTKRHPAERIHRQA